MRKFLLWAVVCLAASAHASVTITANLKDLGQSSSSSGMVARLELKGCSTNIPRVIGTGLIVFPSKDFTPDNTGLVTMPVYANSQITCGTTTGGTSYDFAIVRYGNVIYRANYILNSSGDVSQMNPTTSEPVVPAPTGDATYLRLDLGNLGSMGPGFAVTSLTVPNAGVFTNTQMNVYNQTNLNGCSPSTEYQATELGNFATVGVAGCITQPVGSTVHEADGLFGAVNVAGAATIGVGVRGQARCTVNNAICEGVVPVVEDTAGLTGHSMLGAEIDLPLNGSPALLEGLRILTVNGGGSVPASTWGVHVLPLLAGGGGYRLLGGTFYSEDNVSDTGLILGSKTASANSDSQDLYFHTRDAGNVMHTLILRVPSSLAANRIVEFGDPGNTDFVVYLAAAQTLTNKTLTSPTIATPTISGNVTQGGVTAKVMQVIASGTAVMTTGAITSGTCGSTVTVAATGTLTTDVIDIAGAAAISTPNGLLTLNKWVTANNVNFNYCNPTAGSLTPSALTINWLVPR